MVSGNGKEALEIPKDEPSALATFDYGETAGEGFENTTQDDLAIPFLSILQVGSPIVAEQEIKGAQQGDIHNSVTGELVKGDVGLVAIPCHKETSYVEWIKRVDGGGFVAKHDPKADIVKAAIEKNGGTKYGKLETEDGHDLIETVDLYLLILDEDGAQTESFGVLSLTSTKLKAAKNWYTAMYSIKGKPPIYANRARIKTFADKNKLGKFANIKVSPLKGTWKESLINPVKEAHLIKAAQDFRKMVMDGSAKADYASQTGTDGDEGTPTEAF